MEWVTEFTVKFSLRTNKTDKDEGDTLTMGEHDKNETIGEFLDRAMLRMFEAAGPLM